jgi:hypothetical protein
LRDFRTGSSLTFSRHDPVRIYADDCAFLDKSIALEKQRKHDLVPQSKSPVVPEGNEHQNSAGALKLETALEDGPQSAAIEELLQAYIVHSVRLEDSGSLGTIWENPVLLYDLYSQPAKAKAP